MRSIACVLLVALAGCASKPVAEQVKSEPLKDYVLRGEVLSVDPDTHSVRIKHEAIGDWMGPMTMEFAIRKPDELAKLKPGTYVEGKLHVSGLDSWADEFHDATPPPSQAPAEKK